MHTVLDIRNEKTENRSFKPVRGDGNLHHLINAIEAFAKISGNVRYVPAKREGNFFV